MLLPSHADTFLHAAHALGLAAKLLSARLSRAYADCLTQKFPTARLGVHPQIEEAEVSLSTDQYEFDFSLLLPETPAYLMFAPASEQQERVVLIGNARQISAVLAECHGMEYAVSDRRGSFLICVNWYRIHISGRVADSFRHLAAEENTDGWPC